MLPKNVSEADVSALFSKYGTIKDLQILRGSQQTSKGIYFMKQELLCAVIAVKKPTLRFSTKLLFLAGCAFLKYETKEQALTALEAINGKHKMEVCVQTFITVSENFSFQFMLMHIVFLDFYCREWANR